MEWCGGGSSLSTYCLYFVQLPLEPMPMLMMMAMPLTIHRVHIVICSRYSNGRPHNDDMRRHILEVSWHLPLPSTITATQHTHRHIVGICVNICVVLTVLRTHNDNAVLLCDTNIIMPNICAQSVGKIILQVILKSSKYHFDKRFSFFGTKRSTERERDRDRAGKACDSSISFVFAILLRYLWVMYCGLPVSAVCCRFRCRLVLRRTAM